MGLSTSYFSNVTLISIKKETPYQGGDQMRKKKNKKNKELLNLTIKGKAEEGIIRGIIKALYILQDESARSLC